MRSIRKLFIVTLFPITISPLYSQIVIKTIPNYVLIDTDKNIGKLNEVVNIYRLKGDRVVYVGKVKILKFANGKTGAKVVHTEKGYRIKKGDFVVKKGSGNFKNLNNIIVVKKEKSQIPRSDRDHPKNLLGISFGRFLPSSNLENRFVNAYSMGLNIRLFGFGSHSIFIDGQYPILKSKDSVDLNFSMMLVHLVDHIRIGEWIHFDIGGGLYSFTTESNIQNQSISTTSSNRGFFIGFSIDIDIFKQVTYSPNIRYHVYENSGQWNEFVITGISVNFPIL